MHQVCVLYWRFQRYSLAFSEVEDFKDEFLVEGGGVEGVAVGREGGLQGTY